MSVITLACNAMGTRFELVLHGENEVALRAAGEEALREIQRLDAQLSLYRPTSEIAHLNAHAAERPMRVDPSLFRLLLQARRLSQETGGAFDITIAPLVRCWGFMEGGGQMADAVAVAEARKNVGMHLLELNENDFSVRFAHPGVMLDLGAIGKGFALERAVEILSENGVASGLLHGGTSTVYAIGTPPEAPSWNVAIENPCKQLCDANHALEIAPSQEEPLALVPLQDEALSFSAVWGKSFSRDERIFGHIIDPRTGNPVQGALAAAVIVPSATESDAFSTALLTLGAQGQDDLANLRPGMKTLLVTRTNGRGEFTVLTRGIETH